MAIGLCYTTPDYGSFSIGNRVMLYNSRLWLFPTKVKSKWSGPFSVTQVSPYDASEFQDSDGVRFKVNGKRVKLYIGIVEEIKIVVEILLDKV